MGKLKVGIYSPYLDTASGGEKYMLTIAECLSEQSDVDVLIDSNLESIGATEIKEKNEKRYSLNLKNVNFVRAPIGKGSSFLSRYFFLKKYDNFFLNTDGSIFYSTAKRSYIHFQLPLKNTNDNLWGRIKLMTWTKGIFNSKFTKDHIERDWPIKGIIIYPPVDVDSIKPLKKKKQILSVGRFVPDGVKKQALLIDVFKKMVDEGKIKGWSFFIVGGAMKGSEDYIQNLRRLSSGYNIFFQENISLEDLKALYGESALYWHAMGYNESDPKKEEHFGISTVEAMAAGCVPVVINKGGQKEIVEDQKSGLLWNDLKQLENYTLKLINDLKLQQSLSEGAVVRAKEFSADKFKKKIKELVYEH